MAERRGKHQSIHTALIDDPHFQLLAPNAKLCFFTLKLMLGATGIDVVRAYSIVMAEVTGLSKAQVDVALAELIDAGFIEIEASVIWIPNGLKYNPALSLDNERHQTSVTRHLEGLPPLEIVGRFTAKYGFAEVSDRLSHRLSDRATVAYSNQEVRSKKKEEEERIPFSKENDSELSDRKVMKVIREVAHLDEDRQAQSRSFTVMRQWLKAGISHQEIIDVVNSTREMVDAGEVKWIQPGEAFGLPACRAASGVDGSSQPLYTAALDRQQSDKPPPRGNGLERVEVEVN